MSKDFRYVKLNDVDHDDYIREESTDLLLEENGSREQMDDVPKATTKSSSFWTVSLLVIITLSRTTGGLFISILGPTLLSLANNVGSSVGDISWVFSGRSFGILAGSVATGFIMKRVNNMLSFGLAHFLLGTVMLCTPLIKDLWQLVVVTTVGSIGFGFLDAGMQALLLQAWGAQSSRSLIAYYHFTFVIGAFFAPLLAEYYLTVEDNSSRCPNTSHVDTPTNITKMSQNHSKVYTTLAPNQPNPIFWAYLEIGLLMFAVGLLFFVFGCFRIESHVRSAKKEIVETRKEDQLKDVFLLFVFVAAFYFFVVSGEAIYSSYIYSITICSDLNFSVKAGTAMNTLFWMGFAAGRLSGVAVANCLTPTQVISGDLVVGTISMITVCVLGESTAVVTWIVTFVYSFFQGTVYPFGVSWTSQYTNMSGSYIFIFTAGATVGNFVLLPVAGQMFDSHPFSVLNLVLFCCIGNSIAFFAMVTERKWRARTS